MDNVIKLSYFIQRYGVYCPNPNIYMIKLPLMKLFIRDLVLENYRSATPKQALDEMDYLYEDVMSGLETDTEVPADVLNSFKIKNTLNPEIWPEGKLNPKVRTKLLRIAIDFFKSLDLPEHVKLKDVIFTGSLANFNWSKFSDIDLHLVLDFKEIEGTEKFKEEFFWAHKDIWNQEHNITVFQFPVEIYVQDAKAKLEATAIYSIGKDKWLLKPKKENFNLDRNLLKNKAEKILGRLRDIKKDYLNKDYKSVVDKVTKIKDALKKMRTAGLEKGGEFSLENLLFKVLRRTPFLDLLDSYKAKSYDAMMSVAETLNENNIHQQGGALLMYGRPLEDGTKRLYAMLTKQLSHHNRNKVGGGKGKENRNIIKTSPIYRISIENGKLKLNGVIWGNDEVRNQALGLNGDSVGLHYNKTPLHQEALRFNNLGEMIGSLKGSILALPNVKWMG